MTDGACRGPGRKTVCGAIIPGSVMRVVSTSLAAFLALGLTLAAHAAELPILDAHLHYSHDAVISVPPDQAIAILRQAGLRKAMVSSSDDDGTQKLFALAPDLIVPVLRPYRRRADLSIWLREDAIIAYLEDRLARFRYAGIGEFHVYGADADLPNMRRVVDLARKHRLFLHAHGDVAAIERLFAQNPGVPILWAHSGFDRPEVVADMLRRYPALWCDLAFRNDQAFGDKVDPAWRAVFEAFPDRFMVGTDTFTPERWHYIGEHARFSRAWLADLPPALAERIAWRNGEALLATMGKP